MIAIHQLTFPRQQRVRILNALHDAYVTTAEEAAAKTERWWLMRRNMGRACVASLKAALAEVGLSFAESQERTVLTVPEAEAVVVRILERCEDPIEVMRRIARAYGGGLVDE